MQIPRIDAQNAVGLVDKVAGLAKEIFGSLVGNDRLSEAGQVQQDKGSERIEALKSQARADAHTGKATAAGQAQKTAQKTKEAMS